MNLQNILTTWNHGCGLDECKVLITLAQIIEMVLLRRQVSPGLAHTREGDQVDLEVLEHAAKVDDGLTAAIGDLALEYVCQESDLYVDVVLNVHETLAREPVNELGLALVVLSDVELAEDGIAVGVESKSHTGQYFLSNDLR